MTAAVPHKPFTADDVDVAAKPRPWWLPRKNLDPDFRIDDGEFPHSKDKALTEKEEQQ